jgi:hypothetical protein
LFVVLAGWQLVDVRADLAALDPPDDAADEFERMLGALAKAPKQVRAPSCPLVKGP